jgi:hypothetical protein
VQNKTYPKRKPRSGQKPKHGNLLELLLGSNVVGMSALGFPAVSGAWMKTSIASEKKGKNADD